jgi:hypothetical protein
MRELRRVAPGPDQVRRAMERARAAVEAAPRAGSVAWRIAPLGALAVAVVVVGAVWLSWPVSSANAAERLIAATEAVKLFDGWVKIQSRVDGEVGECVAYVDVKGGATASIAEQDGARTVVLSDPASGTCWRYNSAEGRIHITRLDGLTAEERRRYSERMLTGDGLVGMLRESGNPVQVRVSAEGDLDRYELRFGALEGREPGRSTLWVNRQSGRIEKMHGSRLGCWGNDAVFSYGVGRVEDVYALSVPRTAQVVDERIVVAEAAAGPAAMLDRKGLLGIVRGVRSAVRDLTITASEQTTKPVPDMANWSRYTVTLQGERRRIDHQYSWEADGAGRVFHHITTWDGAETVTYMVDLQQAMAQAGLTQEASVQGKLFFDLQLLSPPRVTGNGVDAQSLEGLLSAELTQVRGNQEVIDGRWCHVVDAPGATMWLDAERGCVPLRQVFRSRHNVDQQIMEFRAEMVEKVDGVWFVTRGRKQLSLPAEYRMPNEEARTAGWIIQVERDSAGRPAIAVNQGAADKAFDLRAEIPEGVPVIERE